MTKLARNQKVQVGPLGSIPGGNFEIEVTWNPGSCPIDIFGLLTEDRGGANPVMYDANGEGVVFYNQPEKDGVRMVVNEAGKVVFSVPGRWLQDGDVRSMRIAAAIDAEAPDASSKSLANVEGLTVRVKPSNQLTNESAWFVAQPGGFNPGITAGILADLYVKSNIVRVADVSQGWEGGDMLRLLAEHGGQASRDEVAPQAAAPRVVVEEPAPEPQRPAIDMVKERRRVNLEKIESIPDERTRQDMRKAYIDMTKKVDSQGLSKHKCKVALVLDVSASASERLNNLYGYRPGAPNGLMQVVALNALALAMEWDTDGKVDVFVFDTTCRWQGALDLQQAQTFMSGVNPLTRGTGTNYSSIVDEVDRFYFTSDERAPFEQGEAVYAIVATDGDAGDRSRANQRFDQVSATRRVFWKFFGVGKTTGFSYLESLDERNSAGNKIDAIDFVPIGDPNVPNLGDLMLKEFAKPEPVSIRDRMKGKRQKPAWLEQASGLLAPAPAGPRWRPSGPDMAGPGGGGQARRSTDRGRSQGRGGLDGR